MKSNIRIIRKTKGFTLIELMLVIVGGLVLIGVGLVAYKIVQSSTGSYKGSEGILQISSGVKSIFPSPNYTGLTATVVIDAGKAPDNMISDTGGTKTLVNAWGGTVTLAPVGYPGPTGSNAFAITFPQVPSDACNTLVAAVAANFPQIKVGTTVVKDDGSATPVTLDPPTVVTACAASQSNTLVLTTT